MSLVIAIDAMGGDHAPREVVRGAVEAARAHPDLRLLLVGREGAVKVELESAGKPPSNIEVVPAEHVIEMGDSPVEALRRKKNSSIAIAAGLVRSGQAVAMVSAGNTGACVAAGQLVLGVLPGVRRAGIAVAIRAGDRPVIVIDVGANVSAKPEHLIQYGIMASLYARSVLRLENPRVGLLNIGEENEKGTPLAKTTHSLFQKTRLNFVGNVEGVEIFKDVCDVVVCDGFVGNIVLKVSEGLAERLADLFKQELEKTLEGVAARAARAPVAAASMPSSSGSSGSSEPGGDERSSLPALAEELLGSFSSLKEKLDYSEYGGAPLLGVKGVMIIAHGRSGQRAISNAIRVARRMTEMDVNRHITEEIRACKDGV